MDELRWAKWAGMSWRWAGMSWDEATTDFLSELLTLALRQSFFTRSFKRVLLYVLWRAYKKKTVFLYRNRFLSFIFRFVSLISQAFSLFNFCSLKSFFVTKMTRRLNVDELNRIAAKNGFVTDVHFEKNQIQQHKNPFTSKYLKNQKKFLKLWATLIIIDVDSVENNDSLMIFS